MSSLRALRPSTTVSIRFIYQSLQRRDLRPSLRPWPSPCRGSRPGKPVSIALGLSSLSAYLAGHVDGFYDRCSVEFIRRWSLNSEKMIKDWHFFWQLYKSSQRARSCYELMCDLIIKLALLLRNLDVLWYLRFNRLRNLSGPHQHESLRGWELYL